jgi:hypothetical protein
MRRLERLQPKGFGREETGTRHDAGHGLDGR